MTSKSESAPGGVKTARRIKDFQKPEQLIIAQTTPKSKPAKAKVT